MSNSLTATVAMQLVVQLIDPATGKPAKVFGTEAENELLSIQSVLQGLCEQPPQEQQFEVRDPACFDGSACFDDAEMDYLSPETSKSMVRMVMRPYRRAVNDPQRKLDPELEEIRAGLCRASKRLLRFLRETPFDQWRLEIPRPKTVLLPLQTSDALLKNDIFMRRACKKGFVPARLALTSMPAVDEPLMETPNRLLRRNHPAEDLTAKVLSLDEFRKK
jgi:hypothetical protein